MVRFPLGVLRLAALSVLFASASFAGSEEEIPWCRDYSQAQAEAARRGRPLVIVVGSEQCGWCRKLDRTTLRDPRVVRLLSGSTVALKIDANDPAHEALMDSLGVEGIPHTAVIAPGGRIVKSRSGYMSVAAFLGLVRWAPLPESQR